MASAIVKIVKLFSYGLVICAILPIAFVIFYAPFYEWLICITYELFTIGEAHFRDTVPYVYVSIVGIIVTIAAIIFAYLATRENQRKQDSIKILIEGRFSPEYESWVRDSRIHFASKDDASAKKFHQFRNIKGGYNTHKAKEEKRASAQAVASLLNYYEFMSVALIAGNLDEEMLKKSFRGILCRLVFTMRDIIRDIRNQKGHEKTFEDLVNVYWRWVKTENPDEWDPERGIDLGREEPTDRRAKKRKAKLMARVRIPAAPDRTE